MQLIPIIILLGLITFVCISPVWAQNAPTWFLGSDIEQHTDYFYTICDYEYNFNPIINPCYNIMLSFEDVLQGPHGGIWMVQAKIDHGDGIRNAVLYIDPITFETKSVYATNRKYAESIERVLFWPGMLAPEYNPKILSIGQSWGNAPLHQGFESEMLVRERLDFEVSTYEIGYPELKMWVQEEFPFPIQIVAKNHLPTSSDRFIVKILDEASFNIQKEYDNKTKQSHFESVISTSNTSKYNSVSDMQIDSNTLHMLSLIYDSILTIIKNSTNTSELLP